MEVSVLIPLYNAAPTLKGVLADLKAQTLRRRETVFVDDGSTDSTAEILAAAGRADPTIRVAYVAHGGIPKALQTGLALCRAPVVVRMDASVAFRRELPARYGGYRDGPFPEDYELWLRLIEHGVRMEKLPQTLLCWNDPPHRLSRTDTRYLPDAFFAAKAPFLARETERLRGKRPIWLWGAGRRTRRRMRHLEEHGCRPAGYVDVDPKKLRSVLPGNRPVIGPADLPPPREAFVLGCVGKRGAREHIRASLAGRGYREGVDFLMCA